MERISTDAGASTTRMRLSWRVVRTGCPSSAAWRVMSGSDVARTRVQSIFALLFFRFAKDFLAIGIALSPIRDTRGNDAAAVSSPSIDDRKDEAADVAKSDNSRLSIVHAIIHQLDHPPDTNHPPHLQAHPPVTPP